MIKIISGYSGPGGSTEAHSMLCNLFNDNNFDSIFYGPNDYHLKKCRADLLNNLKLQDDDIVILHFMRQIAERIPVKKLVLSLHEKNLFSLKSIPYKFYDVIHYIRESQRLWHGINHPYFLCPNIHSDLEKEKKNVEKVAGIIGHIDPNKKVHISIQRALKDGFKKIKLYGRVHDDNYYNQFVLPIIKSNSKIVDYPVFEQDKQKMYNSITDVYLSSMSEVCPFVQGECILTGTNFHGNDQTQEDYIIKSKEEILKIWIEQLELV